MTERQKDTAFLRHCIAYEDTAERHKLEETIAQLQRDERCIRRAAWLMALLAGLAMAGLCYVAVLLPDSSLNMSQFATQFIIKIFCALGVGSLLCLVAFLGFGVVRRKESDSRRAECRRLATKLMESRLGLSGAMTLPALLKAQKIIANENETVVSEKELSS
jgi:hypothetical protein